MPLMFQVILGKPGTSGPQFKILSGGQYELPSLMVKLR
jgi:hypothetical protein